MEMDVYLPLAVATIALLAGYIALLHMASRFFNRPEMTAYANVELQQLFISVIIFVIAIGAFEMANMAGTAIAGQPPIDASLRFLHKTINSGVMPAYMDLMSLDIKLTFWSALEGRQGPTVWNFIAKQVTGLEPVISVVRVLTFTITTFFGTLGAQVIVFYLIQALMPIFLSAGVLLRFFPPTRDAGVYLIVFAISFQSMFPLLFTINAQIMDEMWQLQGLGDSYDPYVAMPSDLLGSEAPEYSPSWVSEIVGSTTGSSTGPTTTSQAIGFFPFVSFFRFYLLGPFFEGIASLSLPALFLPAIAMSITISFINALTKFVTGKG
ncbi:MAG: hypothetical protein NTY83_00090 [Candidatus Micrarchaeota archaeon]|nr:hypothetical protein [Candidatus Micrarchaeota archaeon]